jgi:hypothetical protein
VDHLVTGVLQWPLGLSVDLGGSPPVSLKKAHRMQPSGFHHIKRIMSKTFQYDAQRHLRIFHLQKIVQLSKPCDDICHVIIGSI